MTVVATGDDFRPWEKTARRFAVLKDRRLVPLEKKAGLTLHKEEWLEESPRT
jgi:hypothetical protein